MERRILWGHLERGKRGSAGGGLWRWEHRHIRPVTAPGDNSLITQEPYQLCCSLSLSLSVS